MNGFANTILSFLLSWIRGLVANIWTVVNSPDGGALYRFLADNWLTLLLILCIGGFIVDRLVYLIRWRPYYVWVSRWNRLRGRDEVQPEPVQEQWFEPEPQDYAEPAYQPEPTMAYAPTRRQEPTHTQVYAPAEADEPVFDEPAMRWDEPEPEPWQEETLVSFGRPRPEPIDYFRDVQAGFAPAVPPEQLYAPRYQPTAQEQSPVHPGLDDQTFRQSIGLEEDAPQPTPVMRAPAFQPFTAAHDDEPVRAQSPLARLARRARSLIGDMDEDNPITINDLQSTVDVSQAFHEPVYPQPMNKTDGDR